MNATLEKVSYYRLKQIDLNGEVNYTEARKINAQTAVSTVEFFPNPATNNLTVQLPSISEAVTGEISIINQVGQKVYSQQLTNANLQEVSLQAFKSGVYILETVINGSVSRSQFIKN